MLLKFKQIGECASVGIVVVSNKNIRQEKEIMVEINEDASFFDVKVLNR